MKKCSTLRPVTNGKANKIKKIILNKGVASRHFILYWFIYNLLLFYPDDRCVHGRNINTLLLLFGLDWRNPKDNHHHPGENGKEYKT